MTKDSGAAHFTSVMPRNSANMIGNIFADSLIFPLTQFKEDLPLNVASCMVTQTLPTANIWKTAYDEDKETSFTMKLLHPKSEFSEKDLRFLHASYCHPFARTQNEAAKRLYRDHDADWLCQSILDLDCVP